VADAGSEASVITVDPPDAGAAVDGAAPSGLCGNATVCETFDTPDWMKAWPAATPGTTLATMPGDATSAPSSLVISLKNNNSIESLLRPLRVGAKRYYARLQIKVSALGDGEIDLFGLRNSMDPRNPGALVLVYSANQRGLVLERSSTTTSDTEQTLVTSDLSNWTEVTIGLDYTLRAAGQFTVTVNNVPLFGKDLPADFPKPTAISVELGLLFASGVTRQWTVRVDDVVAGDLD